MSSRKRAAGNIGVLIALPLLYLLSFGPACWWYSEMRGVFRAVPSCYWPLGSIAKSSDGGWIYQLITWYALLGRSEQTMVIPVVRDDTEWLPLVRTGLPPHI